MTEKEKLLRRALVCIEDPRAANEYGSEERIKLARAIRKNLEGDKYVRRGYPREN